MDNCEHLLDAVADVVVELNETCPHLSVLCTSREALQVPEEVVWRLPPLTDQDARVELFTQRARASGATLPDGSAEAVDRLCTALDGLPLAIELAATQSGSTTIEELIRIAEHGTDELARRGDHTRLRSLDAVVAWSLDCLPPSRRASLLVLSVLPGRFDLDMATTVLSSVEACEADAVRPLARASLIDLDGESYRILDTIRHAARRHLANDPEPRPRRPARAPLLGAAGRSRALPGPTRLQRRADRPPAGSRDRAGAGHGRRRDRHRDAVGAGQGDHRLSRGEQPDHRSRPPGPGRTAAVRCRRGPPLRLRGGRARAGRRTARGRRSAGGHLRCRRRARRDVRLRQTCTTGSRGATPRAATWTPLAGTPMPTSPTPSRPDADDIDRSLVHGMQSVIAQAAGDWEEALVHAERELLDSKKFASDIDLGTSEGNLAEALLDAGRPDDALLHAAEAVRLIPLPSPRRRFMLLQLARAQASSATTKPRRPPPARSRRSCATQAARRSRCSPRLPSSASSCRR